MSTRGLDSATPPLRTAPRAGSALLTFLPDTWLLRASSGNQKDMPREGGHRVSKPRSRTLSLGTCSGSSSHRGQLSAECLQQQRSHQARRRLCPFRLPSVLSAQCMSCEPALGSLLGGDFPASGHTRARFHLQPAAKATLLFPSRQQLEVLPLEGVQKRSANAAQLLLSIPPRAGDSSTAARSGA